MAVGQAGLALLGDEQSSNEAALMNDTIAWSYWWLGQLEQASEFTLRNTVFLASLPYTEALGGVYMHIAYIYVRSRGEIAEGLRWIDRVRHKAAQVHDLRTMARAYFFTAAEISDNSGDLHHATIEMEQAAQGFKKIGDVKQEVACLSRLGWILIRRGQLSAAETCLAEASRKDRLLGNIGDIGAGHANLGLIHLCRYEWNAVEINLRNSLDSGQKNNLPSMHIVWINFLLGRIYLLQNRLQEARRQLEHTMAVIDAAEIRGLPEAKAQNYMRLLASLEKAFGDPSTFWHYAQLIQSKDTKELDMRFVQPLLQPAQPDSAFLLLDCSFSASVPNHVKSKLSRVEWQWCDPLDDCSYDCADGLLLRAANARDLYRHNRSAPRLLRPVSGDFAAQIICTPVSDAQPAIGGLIIWQDEHTYLRLDKGLLGADEISFRCCLLGQDVMIGRGRLPGERIFLRLERWGAQVRALCSSDGRVWFTSGVVTFPLEDSLKIGIYAIGDIDRWFYPGAYPDGTAIRFESFALYKRE